MAHAHLHTAEGFAKLANEGGLGCEVRRNGISVEGVHKGSQFLSGHPESAYGADGEAAPAEATGGE